MAANTPTRPVRFPPGLWQLYGPICDRLDTNRSARIVELVCQDIREHGDPHELWLLAAIEQELAQPRRGRRPYTGTSSQDGDNTKGPAR